MKQKDIKVGATYVSRGQWSQRRVICIGVECRPDDMFSDHRPKYGAAIGVEYTQRIIIGQIVTWSEPRYLWLDTFAKWAGKEVKP
jgi:hypothetical protein